MTFHATTRWDETPCADWASLRLDEHGTCLTIKERGTMRAPRWEIRIGGCIIGVTRDRSPAMRRFKALEMAETWARQCMQTIFAAQKYEQEMPVSKGSTEGGHL